MIFRPQHADRTGPTSHGRSWLVATLVIAAAVGSACSSDPTVATGPTQAKCQVALTASTATIAGQGGSGTVTVTASPECPWDASTGASWLSGLQPTSGQGNGTVQFSAAPNPLPSEREGEILVNDNRLRVTQQAAPCRFEVRPEALAVDAPGGNRDIAVSATSGCSWTATTDVSWISFATPVTRSGDGSVSVRIAANTGDGRRVGTVSVADQRVTVTQEAAVPAGPACEYVVSSASPPVLAADASQVAVSVNVAGGCAWTASSTVPGSLSRPAPAVSEAAS